MTARGSASWSIGVLREIVDVAARSTSGCDLVAGRVARRSSAGSDGLGDFGDAHAVCHSGDLTRPCRDLGAPRRPELGEDVLDVRPTPSWARCPERPRSPRSYGPHLMSRATSNSRAVSGCQGWFIDTWPRAIRSTASARAASGALSRREAVERTSAATRAPSAKRPARMWLAARSSRAQFASQTRPCDSQPRAASSSRVRAAVVDPFERASSPRP